MALSVLNKFSLWLHALVVIAVYAIYYSYPAHDFSKYILYTFFGLLAFYAAVVLLSLIKYFRLKNNQHIVSAWYFFMVFMLIFLVVE